METKRLWSQEQLDVNDLLPIREAYEWKHPCTQGGQHAIRLSCFQFVKRMNGNPKSDPPDATSHTLASNSWSVWMETPDAIPKGLSTPSLLPIREAYEWKLFLPNSFDFFEVTCFQFVKRMNGNPRLLSRHLGRWPACFQFVKRMNGNYPVKSVNHDLFNLASNSWSVWMEKMCRVNSWINPTIFLIPIS